MCDSGRPVGFCFCTLLVQFRAMDQIELPRVSGSTFRGAFGRAFRRVECRRPGSQCKGCYLQAQCLYWRYFFRTSLGDKNPVRPYILETPLESPSPIYPGEPVTFAITLVGEAIDHLLKFFAIFEEMGKCGLGQGWRKGKARCSLESVNALRAERSYPIYPMEKDKLLCPGDIKRHWSEFFAEPDEEIEKIRVHFLTHTRIKEHGKYLGRIPFHVLVKRLIGRISDLDKEYCGKNLDIPEKELISKAELEVHIQEEQDHTKWVDWERHPHDPNNTMRLVGGVVGDTVYEGRLTPFVPYLLIGEYIHVGKQATFGNGTIKIDIL